MKKKVSRRYKDTENSGHSSTLTWPYVHVKTQQTIQLFEETDKVSLNESSPCVLKNFQVCLHKWTTDACTNKCQMMIASPLVEFEVGTGLMMDWSAHSKRA